MFRFIFSGFRASIALMLRAAMLLLLLTTFVRAETLHYPPATRGKVVDDYFGTQVPDPYRWLEDLDSPATKEWVNAEEKLTSDYLQKLPDHLLFKDRLTKLFDYVRYSPPFWRAGRYLYRENTGLQNQSLLYSIKNLADKPELVIDPNRLSSDGTVTVDDFDLSSDGRLLAYSTAASGSDWTEIHVKDIESHQDLPDLIRWVKFSGPAWTHDGKGFFYARFEAPDQHGTQNGALKNQRVYYHRLGETEDHDQLVYTPSNPDWLTDVFVSKSGKYMLLEVSPGASDRNRLYFADLGDPDHPKVDATIIPIVNDFQSQYLTMAVVGDDLFVRTDNGAPKYKIVRINLKHPERKDWQEIVPESKDLLEQGVVAGRKLVLNYLVDAKNELKILDLTGGGAKQISLPTLGSVVGLSGDEDRPEVFYGFTSFLYPTTIYRYDIASGHSVVWQKPDLDLSTEKYQTTQMFYPSKDGTKIPMFLVSRKGVPRDGSNPVFLYGYGGFNILLKPTFDPFYLAWAEKGGLIALANLRGGGEYGQTWHAAGTKERKQNVFDDFIAAAETLIQDKYTVPARIAINGASNGGLLVGAVMTQRPDLFGAAVPRVGVMDMLRYQKFTIGRAWASDYGTSDDATAFKYLIKYSPLQNIKPGTCYPPTLITTADHDDRVVPSHSFKFAAALQAAQACDHPVLIRIDTKAGHGGGKPITKQIEEDADILSFMWHFVGFSDNGKS